MALGSATISYDFSDLTGVDFDRRRTKIWVSTNIDDGTVIDTVGNAIRVDTGLGTLAADGTGSVVVWTPGTGSNPDSWQTYVHFDYASPMDRTRKRRTFGPFTVTTSANLADLVEEQEVPAEYLTTITAALQVLVDDAEASEAAAEAAEVAAEAAQAAAEAARDDAIDISGIATPDAVIAAAIALTSSDTFEALGRVISITSFGAVGDGVADETTAFNAAIAAINATGGVDRGNITGLTIDLGNGRYKLPTALNAITVSGGCFRGVSQESTVLLMSANGPTFTFGLSGGTPVGFELSHCKIEYLADPGASATVLSVETGYSVKLADLELVGIGTLLKAGGATSARICGGAVVVNVKGSIANVGRPLFDLRYGAGLTVDNMQVFVKGVVAPTHPTAMTTVAGTYVIRGDVGFWDTVHVSNSLFERFDAGLVIAAGSGDVYQNFYFTNTIFDYCKSQGIYADAASGGVVAGIRVHNCWFVSWETNNIEFVGAGYNDAHDIQAILPISGGAALNYTVAAKNNKFSLNVGANSRATTPAAAVLFGTGATGFIMNGSQGNEDYTGAGTPWRNDWGMAVAANCDDFSITGNKFAGAVAAYNCYATNTSGSTKRLMAGNIGLAGVNLLTLGASTAVVTNKTAHVQDVHIYGGTVTVIAKNGTTITGMTSGTMRVEPGETFAVTYSVAPTLTAFVHL